MVMRTVLIALATFISFAVAASPKDSVAVKLNNKRHYVQSHQYEIVNRYQGEKMKVVRYEDRTELEICLEIMYDSQWFIISSNVFLYDRETKDKYMLHSTMGDIPTDHLSVVRGLNGKRIKIKLIFPPLKPGIDKIDFVSHSHPLMNVPTNGSGWGQHNLKVHQGVTEAKRARKKGRVIKMGDNPAK